MQRTADKTTLISSLDVARILGVNVATVKRWTDSGKLDCMKTAGGHRKFHLRHLAAFARNHEKYSQKLSLLPLDTNENRELSSEILRSDYTKLSPRILHSALACDQSTLSILLNGLYMVHQDLVGIYQDLLTPVLQKIGELWMHGEITVTQEHLASQTLRDGIIKLQDVVIQPELSEGKVFVLTLSEELHDIPAKMIQHIMEARGYQVLYSGQKTPAGDTDSVFSTFKPDRVYLSVVYTENKLNAQAEVLKLLALCEKHEVVLYAGGTGLDLLALSEDAPIRRLASLKEVNES